MREPSPIIATIRIEVAKHRALLDLYDAIFQYDANPSATLGRRVISCLDKCNAFFGGDDSVMKKPMRYAVKGDARAA